MCDPEYLFVHCILLSPKNEKSGFVWGWGTAKEDLKTYLLDLDTTLQKTEPE